MKVLVAKPLEQCREYERDDILRYNWRNPARIVLSRYDVENITRDTIEVVEIVVAGNERSDKKEARFFISFKESKGRPKLIVSTQVGSHDNKTVRQLTKIVVGQYNMNRVET